MFGESVGSDGDDFDLSKLQALLKKNSLEIDNILRGSPEKLMDKSARSLSFSELTSPRKQNIGVKSALSEDLTVSYESKPSGGFNVFYTVPKESLEKSKMEKIKDLIQNINKKTILSNNLDNSIDEYEDDEYYDEDDEYYEDEYYEDYESDYYADESLSSIKSLKSPPGPEDDYYDPGPPSSYYDDSADYIDDDADFDYTGDYDYEDDYYDQAESRMIIQSSTINPLVLSPTIQKLNALTLQHLNGGKKKRRTSKKRRNKKKSIDRSLDLSGKNNRTKRSAYNREPSHGVKSSGNIVHNRLAHLYLDTNALEQNVSGKARDNLVLDPTLYDVQFNKDILEPDTDSTEYIPYPYEFDDDPYPEYEPYEPHPYPEYEPYEHHPYPEYEDDEIFYDEVTFGEEDFLFPFEKKKPPVVQRTWLDNVLKFRESLFGEVHHDKKYKHGKRGGKPQVTIHYPEDEDPYVTVTEAKRPPLDIRPSVFNSGGSSGPQGLPPVVSIQNPVTTISQPATVISQPSLAVTPDPPPVPADPSLQDFPDTPAVSIDDFVRSRANPVPSSTLDSLNTLARLRTAINEAPDDSSTITRLLDPELFDRLKDKIARDEEQEKEHIRKHKRRHKKHKHHHEEHSYYPVDDHHYNHHFEEPPHYEDEPYYYRDKHPHETTYPKEDFYHHGGSPHHFDDSYHDPPKKYHHDPHYIDYYDEDPHHHPHGYHHEEHPIHYKEHSGYHHEEHPIHYKEHGGYHHEEHPIHYEEHGGYHHKEHPTHYKEHPVHYNKHGRFLPEEHPLHYEDDSIYHSEDPHQYSKEVPHHDKYTNLFLRSDGSYKPSTEIDDPSLIKLSHELRPDQLRELLDHQTLSALGLSRPSSHQPPHFLPEKHRIIPFTLPQDPVKTHDNHPNFLPPHRNTPPPRPTEYHHSTSAKFAALRPPSPSSPPPPPPPPTEFHHSTSAYFATKTPKPIFKQPVTPSRYLVPPYPALAKPRHPDGPRKTEPLVTISIGAEPSVSIHTPNRGVSPNIKITDDQTRPKPIHFSHTPIPSKVPYDYLHPTSAVTARPQTRSELLKKLAIPEHAYKRDLVRNFLPPTLYDKTPPTLYDQLYPRGKEEKEFAPPRLQDYLPPTLFDAVSSINRRQPETMKLQSNLKTKTPVPHNPFMKYKSVKDNKDYYRKQLLPERETSPDDFKQTSENIPSDLSAGVGNKNGPIPSKVYKAQLKFPPKQLLLPKKPPAIKFEVINDTKPAVKFEGSEEVYPVIYYSDRKSINPDEYLRSKLIDRDRVYSYKSKIRYRDNLPVQTEQPFYQSPTEELTDVKKTTTQRNVDSNGYISVLGNDRLYRHDFPKSSERDYYNVTKRHIASSQVPCQGTTPCVLVQENSSITYDQDVIPSSQLSSLPFPTQLPRPPLSSSKLPYLPFASYKTTAPTRKEFVKSLPTFTPSSVRTRPQYPYHKSYVLAKLKRKDIPK